jgi:uncharacterized protein (TIGR00369 family)
MTHPAIERVRAMFARAAFVNHLGIELVGVGNGTCECVLTPKPEHLQQNGFVHAGVLTTLADHTAGGAAITALPEDRGVLSTHFAVQLMRPAQGRLRCRAEVLRAGKSLVFTEATVFAGSPEKPVVKMALTLAVVPTDLAAR